MERVLDVILTLLEFAYGRPWIALCVLIFMFICAGIIIFLAHRRTAPYLNAAKARVAALKSVLGTSGDIAAERQSFGDGFLDVATAMSAAQAGSAGLTQAWREFRETILDESASPVRSTNRPGAYFRPVAPRLDDMIFASNAFVAAGLILTFVGLVVALHTAGANMGDVDKAKGALTLLLTVASAKFLTSIGGIGASLWLRFAEQGISKRVSRQTDSICNLLERGLVYIAPQRLAAEQLEVLKDQRDQLKFFNTDVAMQLSERIGVQFQQAIAPVTASLSVLNDNMINMSQGLGQGAAKAIEEATGGELRALSQTLSVLGERLASLSAHVGDSGEDAARQIRAAGEDFAQAAADVREAFTRLTGQVDGVGGKLAEQTETVAKAQSEALERVLLDLQATQSRSADAVGEAVRALQTAGAQAAEVMQREVGAALAQGVAESQRTFRAAIDESGDGIKGAAGEISRAVREAAEQVERAGVGFARTGENAARTAEAMVGITGEARSVAISMGDAAKGFSTAATPVAQATQVISEAAGRMVRVIEGGRERDAETMRGMKELADGIRETQNAAETAWRDYRARFEGVDKSLEATVLRLSEALRDSLDQFQRFAQSFDSEMAGAVSKLSNALTAIEEYAGSLDEYVDVTTRPRKTGTQ